MKAGRWGKGLGQLDGRMDGHECADMGWGASDTSTYHCYQPIRPKWELVGLLGLGPSLLHVLVCVGLGIAQPIVQPT